MGRRLCTAVIAVLAITLGTTGCAANPNPPAAASSKPAAKHRAVASPATAATPSDTPSSTPTPPSDALTDTWTDQYGYQYSLSVTPTAPTVTVDVADAAPGQAMLKVSDEFDGTLTNQTAGHNAPYPDVKVLPLWAGGSEVCSTQWASNISDNADGTKASPAVCELGLTSPTIGPSLDATTDQITPGETVKVIATLGLTVTVPQGKADMIASAITNPDAYAFSRDGGKTRCLSDNGAFVAVTSSPTTCQKG